MPSKRREGVTRMRYIVLSQRGSEIVIEKQEIDYIERENRVTKFYLEGQMIEVAEKLADVQKYLDQDTFVRCHNSFIVNLEKIRSFGRSEFILKNGKSVPISRSRYGEVRESFVGWTEIQE